MLKARAMQIVLKIDVLEEVEKTCEDMEMLPNDATKYLAVVARINFLASDRPDILIQSYITMAYTHICACICCIGHVHEIAWSHFGPTVFLHLGLSAMAVWLKFIKDLVRNPQSRKPRASAIG